MVAPAPANNAVTFIFLFQALKNKVIKSIKKINAAYIRLERKLKSMAEKEAALEKRRIQEEEHDTLSPIEIITV